MSQIQQQFADDNVGSQRSSILSSDDGSTRVSDSRKAELEVLLIRTFQTLILPVIETLVRRIVREETGLVQERVMTSINQNSGSKINHSKPRILQLKFLNMPGHLVLTGKKITGADGTPLKVALVDVSTGEVVNSGPEALARVEIGVVQLNSDGAEEFNQHTHLLMGDTCVNMEEGIASMDNISFPHKKKYAKKSKLMLGARIVGNFDGTGVQEAKSEPFILEDRRQELYKKHYPPSLSDEVWRLKKIGRTGPLYERLSGKNIKTVEQFLTQYFTNCQGLQEMLGSNMTDKMLNEAVEHGLTCKLDNRYVYRPPGSTKGVVFNVVGQAVGVVLESHYVPISNLPEAEKDIAQKLVVSAFKQGLELVPYEGSCLLYSSSLSVNEPSSSNASVPESSSFDTYVYSPHGSTLTTGEAQNVAGETVEAIPERHYDYIGDLSRTEKGFGQKPVVSVSRHGKELVVHDDMSFPESSFNLVDEPSSSNSEVQGSFSFGNNVGCSTVMEKDIALSDICSPTNIGSSRSFERTSSTDSWEELINACDMDYFRDVLRSSNDDDDASLIGFRTMSIALRFARKMLMEIRRPGHVPKRQRVN